MTKGTFGDNLKREREMRGVTLDEITAATRIATRFLRAIEDEQWDQLPGGVFNRGFVRAVARYLGLDEENTVAEYALAAGDGPTVPVWTGSPPAVTQKLPWAALAIAGVLVLALVTGGWFAVRRIFAWRSARHAAQISASSSAWSSDKPLLPSTNLLPLTTDPVAGSVEAASKVSANSPASSAGTEASTTSAKNTASAPSDASLELKVEADKSTRVTVEADDHRVFAGRMKAGEGKAFTARDKFQVSAGDAGALLLELNGKTLAPIGPPGQGGKTTLTKDSLKGAAGGGN